jgi:hypothetical protein
MAKVLPIRAPLTQPLEVSPVEDRRFIIVFDRHEPSLGGPGRYDPGRAAVRRLPLHARRPAPLGPSAAAGRHRHHWHPVKPLAEYFSLEPHHEVGCQPIRKKNLVKHAWSLLKTFSSAGVEPP